MASDDSPILLRDSDPFGFACVIRKADTEEVERADIDMHKQGGALPVAGIVPALAEGTAGVEPAGEAK